jgi:hypothetical protein
MEGLSVKTVANDCICQYFSLEVSKNFTFVHKIQMDNTCSKTGSWKGS